MARKTGANAPLLDLLFHHLEQWDPSSRGLPIDTQDVSVIVAHALLAEVDEHFPDGFDLTYRRFMDDTIMFTSDEVRARQWFAEYERVAQSYGLQVNEGKSSLGAAQDIVAGFDRAWHEEVATLGFQHDALFARWRELAAVADDRRDAVWVRRARHVLRRGRWTLAGQPWVEGAMAMLSGPLWREVLQFLAEQPLDDAVVARLVAWASERSDGAKLEVLRACSGASPPAAAELAAAWSSDPCDVVSASARLLWSSSAPEAALGASPSLGRRTRWVEDRRHAAERCVEYGCEDGPTTRCHLRH
jgi:hypothetical protein